MLRTECPSCKEWVSSPFLNEMENTKCPTCETEFQIKEVFVSAGAYSIYRDVLLKSIFKYKRLIAEAQKEVEDLERAGKDKLGYKDTIDSIKLFINNLQEMLNGARSGFRVAPKSGAVLCELGARMIEGRLVNISSTGACVNMSAYNNDFNKGEVIALQLVVGEPSPGISMKGEVMWTSPKNGIGVRFINLNAEAKALIVDYIQEKDKDV